MKTTSFTFALLLSAILMQAQLAFSPVRFGDDNNDESYDICADNTGNLYFTGMFTGPAITFGTFTLVNPSPTTYTAYVVGMNATGVVTFAIAGTGDGDARGVGICPDNLGNVYVIGDFNGTSIAFPGGTPMVNSDPTGNYRDMYVIKIDGTGGSTGVPGTLIWQTSSSGELDELGHNISYAHFGKLAVTGSFSSPVMSLLPGPITLTNTVTTPPYTRDVYIGWLDMTTGAFTQACSLEGTGNDHGHDIAVEWDGTVYVTGNFESPSLTYGTTLTGTNFNPPKNDIFFVQISGTGTGVRMETVVGAEEDYAYSIGLDYAFPRNVVITGGFFSPELAFSTSGPTLIHSSGDPSPDEDYYIVKYTGVTGVSWVKGANANLDPQWNFDDLGRALTIDGSNNIYVIGWYKSNRISFTPGSVLVNSTNNNYAEIFFAKYNPTGGLIWSTDAKGLIDDYGQGVALDSLSGCVHYTGFYESETLSFGLPVLPNVSSPYRDIFVTVACPNATCDEPCEYYADSLHTGVPGIGFLDGSWMLVSDPSGGTVPRPANIISFQPGWIPPFPCTNYISSSTTGSVPTVGTFVFERQFLVEEVLVNPQLTFCVLVDDIADCYVDGILIGSAASYLTPSTFTTGILTPGMHTLRLEIFNSPAIYMGFDLRGFLCYDHFVGVDSDAMATESPLQIWPNPANENVQIRCQSAMNQLVVYSINGQELMQFPADAKETMLPVNHLPDGIYLLRVITATSAYTERLIIRK